MPEFDYLLGVAALDSGHIEDAIIAFERVLAIVPGHAGAQMDLARAYYAAGSFDLAEAAFLKLAGLQSAARRPRSPSIATSRRIQARGACSPRRDGAAGASCASVTTRTSPACRATSAPLRPQSFNIIGIDRDGQRRQARVGVYAGRDRRRIPLPHQPRLELVRGRRSYAGAYYFRETDFNIASGEVHGGAALNARRRPVPRSRPPMRRSTRRARPPATRKPTNDRRIGGVSFDWRHSLDTRTAGGPRAAVERRALPDGHRGELQAGVPRGFLSRDLRGARARRSCTSPRSSPTTDANHQFDNGVNGETSTKSKNLLRRRAASSRIPPTPKLQYFGQRERHLPQGQGRLRALHRDPERARPLGRDRRRRRLAVPRQMHVARAVLLLATTTRTSTSTITTAARFPRLSVAT